MSFICDNCNAPQESGTKPIRRVTKIREKSYVGGGFGWEIEKEVLLGKCCETSVKDARPLEVKS